MNKTEIAAVLTEIGTLLELKGENPFKTRAYQTGARVLEGLGEEEIGARVKAGTLDEVKGIGEALAQKISELHQTGRLEFFEKLKATVPAGIVDLLSIPGLGSKKIRALQDKLGVDSIEKLKAACESGAVAALEGFGEKSQEKILSGIRNREAYGRRHLWIEAHEAGAPILAGLRALPAVQQVESCGSLRRRMETVGDLDFLVATTEPAAVVAWFVGQPQVKEITAQGELKASVRLESGLQADLRLVPPAQFVFTLHHLTGSKDHNVQMRQRALERGLSMSEWGLFPADEKHGPSEQAARSKEQGAGSKEQGGGSKEQGGGSKEQGGGSKESGFLTPDSALQAPGSTLPAPSSELQAPGSGLQAPRSELRAPGSVLLPIKTEADLFAALGLAYIPPELREGRGEIEAAEMEVRRAGAARRGDQRPVTGDWRGDGSQAGGPASLRAASADPVAAAVTPLVSRLTPAATGGVAPGSALRSARLPDLVTEADIRGVFHNHTTASDGHNTLEEMTTAAEALGFDYLGIADHSKSSFQARGLDEARLADQVSAIKRLNESKRFKTWVFAGTECDILPDGRLDFAPEVLAQLDYVVVSVHSSFRQDRETMTARLIKAIEHPHVTMLGHLTGRLLLEREGYEVDVDKIVDAAIANGVAIEINAAPARLDMDWRHWRKAADKGLMTSINPDAHRTAQLEWFRCGVGTARKGWLTKASVLNTRALADIKKYLAARR